MAHRDQHFQAALDGALSPAEAERLAASLRNDPEAQAQFEALKQVDAALRELGTVNPPPDLRASVMRQLQFNRAVQGAPARTRPSWLLGWWKGITAARPAFQVGLGFALGILVLSPLVWDPTRVAIDPAHVTGTFVSPSALSEPLEITGPGLSGSLQRGRLDGRLTFELTMACEKPVEARIDFAAPVGFVGVETHGPGAIAFEYSDRHLIVRHAGTGSYRVQLADAEMWPPMTLRVASEGVSLFEEAVP